MGLTTLIKHLHPHEHRSGEIQCKCPFRENHKDGSGQKSFWINAEKGVFRCWSCKESGNLLRLLTVKLQIPFHVAVENVVMFSFDEDVIAYEDLNKKQGIPEFELPHPLYQTVPQLFIDKGIRRKTLAYFQVSEYENDIVIPIYSGHRLIGLGYRRETPKGKKVWFSKNFPRERVLYNYKPGLPEYNLVEGYTDVWRTWQNGYPDNTVASFGTELTTEQASLLYGSVVNLMYDMDAAGRLAVEIANHMLHHHCDVNVVPYDAEDPGACTKFALQRGMAQKTTYGEYSVEMMMHYEGYEDILKMSESLIEKRKNRL